MKRKPKPAEKPVAVPTAEELGKCLASLTCHLGSVAAMALVDFTKTLEGLDEDKKRILLRGWLAACEMPREASSERIYLDKVINMLRDEWKGKSHAH